jgi:hypothetical protein
MLQKIGRGGDAYAFEGFLEHQPMDSRVGLVEPSGCSNHNGCDNLTARIKTNRHDVESSGMFELADEGATSAGFFFFAGPGARSSFEPEVHRS